MGPGSERVGIPAVQAAAATRALEEDSRTNGERDETNMVGTDVMPVQCLFLLIHRIDSRQVGRILRFRDSSSRFGFSRFLGLLFLLLTCEGNATS